MESFRAQSVGRISLIDAEVSTGLPGIASVHRVSNGVCRNPLPHSMRIREEAFLCFSDSYSHWFAHTLSAKEWKKLLHWLDVSGLALYFFDRMTEIGQISSLPTVVVNRLERSLEDNRQRTHGLFQESLKLQGDFQSAGLSYAVVKGISLYPVSVSHPELRHQFDLDYLITDSDALAARRILEHHGYTLFAISGKSWEFKKGQSPCFGAKDLYRDLPYRGVELHLESSTPGIPTCLHRVVSREIDGVIIPVLSPVDIFVGQAKHAAKDIASPFLRASHLLEFYRHVLARYDDVGFWEELRLRCYQDQRTSVAIGIVCYLITSIWGTFAPRALTSWTLEKLPAPIQLWLDLYGRATIYQVPPGTKHYLRLRQELENAQGVAVFSKPSLLSLKLPPAVIQATPGETLLTRVARCRVQIRFLASRLRFHLVEGLRFVIASRHWHRLRSELP